MHAGLVVDFGDVDTGSARPADTADCVADPGANGVTLLAKRFGKERIRINGTGLICAIDGYPADGCGDHLPNGKYRYWSYWKGGSSWEYSSVGPAGRSISGRQRRRLALRRRLGHPVRRRARPTRRRPGRAPAPRRPLRRRPGRPRLAGRVDRVDRVVETR